MLSNILFTIEFYIVGVGTGRPKKPDRYFFHKLFQYSGQEQATACSYRKCILFTISSFDIIPLLFDKFPDQKYQPTKKSHISPNLQTVSLLKFLYG